MSDKLKITLRKSPIGYAQSQKATARALGLKKLQQSVVRADDPVVRGMIHKIQHLVEVQTVEVQTVEGQTAEGQTVEGQKMETQTVKTAQTVAEE